MSISRLKKYCLTLLALMVLVIAPALPVHIGADGLAWQQAEAATQKKKSTSKKATKKKKTTSKKSTVRKQVAQTETNRWAALVVDANEGRILYEKNADAERHPASLTKMMTLYLLFDALESKRYSMSSMLNVSAKAAGQPPTNIALEPGDRISVEKAILALIIRSANDVAMVVAENLGGSQEGFAKMMNRKARELGMTKTKFYNPSGLPDSRQVSSASDLARLGIALRRDFPEYYHYFKEPDFDYNGRTYTTHNRVIGRYPGADGLKTGYIGASGFNLVTSVTRGSTRLVGVIMGGTTASSRDQEMMNMLDRTIFAMNRGDKSYASIDKKTQAKKPEAKSNVATEKPATAENQAVDTPLAEPLDTEEMAEQEVQEPATGLVNADPALEAIIKEAAEKKPIPQLPPVAPQTLASSYPPSFVSERNWAIQVGAFPTLEQAERAAKNARGIAQKDLAKAQIQISQVVKDGLVFNRSRMIYLSSDEAKSACGLLVAANKVCMIVRMEN